VKGAGLAAIHDEPQAPVLLASAEEAHTAFDSQTIAHKTQLSETLYKPHPQPPVESKHRVPERLNGLKKACLAQAIHLLFRPADSEISFIQVHQR
jgi:hypothetical protein